LFENQIWNPVGSKLSWSHYRELLTVKNMDAIRYYINICEKNNISKRQLQEKIKNHEYDKLSEETKNKLIKNEDLKVDDLIPNPINVKVNSLDKNITEYALKQAILNNLDEFLFQLGNGFTYVGNEYKIKIGSSYNYIDLLLFNYEYNCFIVVELKITELKKEHLGQILIYMNCVDKTIKKSYQDKTIGIIIVKKDNKYVIEYCSDERIISREYELI